jgi:hypothetical protein
LSKLVNFNILAFIFAPTRGEAQKVQVWFGAADWFWVFIKAGKIISGSTELGLQIMVCEGDE